MSVPIGIWNQIAPQIQHKELARIFSMTSQEKADAALSQWAQSKAGSAPMLLAAFEEIAPLLLENVAISKWTASNPQWLMALPEVLTVGEAARLAQADYMLSATETAQLIRHLRAL